MHLFLGIGISYLDMTCRGSFAVCLRGSRHSMDAVLSYPSTAHDYQIAWMGLLQVRRGATYGCWHYAQGRYKDEALSHIGFIKEDLPEWSGNTAFVSAIPYPLNDTIQESPRMEVGLQFAGIVPGAHTESVGAQD